jgi:hypothetical protein
MYHHRRKTTVVLFSFLGLFYEKILNYGNDFLMLRTIVQVPFCAVSVVLAAIP